MGITPNVPGTGPNTDVPSPKNDPFRNEPGEPDINPGGEAPGEAPKGIGDLDDLGEEAA